MNILDAFPSNYFKSSDLNGRRLTLQIRACELEDLGGEQKPVLRFNGQDKGMVLNKTNADALVQAFGNDTNDWRGQWINLFSVRVQFQGRMVDGLRLEVSQPETTSIENIQNDSSVAAPF